MSPIATEIKKISGDKYDILEFSFECNMGTKHLL